MNKTITYPDLGYICELRAIRGRNVSLTVYPNNRIVIRSPKRVSLNFINLFLKERSAWVKLQYEKNRDHNPKKTSFQNQETLPIFGQNRKISWTQTEESRLTPTKMILNLNGIRSESGRIKRANLILRTELENRAVPILEEAIKLVGTKKYSYRFRAMRSLWGSCSSRNEITLNVALAYCPNFVLRYVILHEVSHTREHNHSPRFWNLLASINPEFEDAEHWIKIHGKQVLCYLF